MKYTNICNFFISGRYKNNLDLISLVPVLTPFWCQKLLIDGSTIDKETTVTGVEVRPITENGSVDGGMGKKEIVYSLKIRCTFHIACVWRLADDSSKIENKIFKNSVKTNLVPLTDKTSLYTPFTNLGVSRSRRIVFSLERDQRLCK